MMFDKLRDRLYEWLSYEPPTTDILPYDYDRMRQEIRPGDVILVEGRSRVSQIIHVITRSPWTHALLYIGNLATMETPLRDLVQKHIDVKNIKEEMHLIIEDTLNTGTIISPLHAYRQHHLRVCRPIGIIPRDTQLVLQYAATNLGQPYNVRQLLDLARFLLPWSILPRRWGSSLFATKEGKQAPDICSSLIAESFSSVKFPILPYIKAEPPGYAMYQRNPHLFTPKDFDYSPYFDVIKYPLLYPEEHIPYYRQLPWSKTQALYQDNGIISAPRPSSGKKTE